MFYVVGNIADMKSEITRNHLFCSYCNFTKIKRFVLVISSLLYKSAVDYRDIWNLMHPLRLNLCQDPIVLSYIKLYKALAVARAHLLSVQHCRHTHLVYLSTYTLYTLSLLLAWSPSHTHTHTKYTWQNCWVQRPEVIDNPVNPIPGPTCLVL